MRILKQSALFVCLSIPLAAQSYSGYLDAADCNSVAGWAWNASLPNSPINVDIYDGSTWVTTVSANQFRQDLLNAGIGNGYHGFSLSTPSAFRDGQVHSLSARFGGTSTDITNSPHGLSCSQIGGGYQYYYSDQFSSIIGTNWWQNGNGLTLSNGLADVDPSGAGVSLISKIAAPANDYEVSATMNLTGGGSYILYLRATSNSLLAGGNTGTYYAVDLANPTFSGSACSAGLWVYKNVAGTITVLSSGTVPCHSNTAVRAVIKGTYIIVYVDNTLYATVADSSITAGQPGVGVVNTAATSSIARAEFGPLDQVPPNTVPTQAVGSSAFANRVDLQWEGATDNSTGIGLAYYDVYRNNVWVTRANQVRSA